MSGSQSHDKRRREIPTELYDGVAVYVELGVESDVRPHQVAAVLDAVVKLIRKNDKLSPPSHVATTTPVAWRFRKLLLGGLSQPTSNWGNWHYVDEKPQRVESDIFQIEPLYAASAIATAHFIGVDQGRPGGDHTGYVCSCGQIRVEPDGPCERKDCPIRRADGGVEGKR